MSGSNRLIVSILVIAAAAVGFWVLALSPKREQADELGGQAETLQVSLAEAQSKVAQAKEARTEFPADYHQLVVLGQAVPAGDETSSLLVELQQLATKSKVKFNSIQLEGDGEQSAPVTSSPGSTTTPEGSASAGSTNAVPASDTVPPTEAAASLLPLGATIGPAGLGVMPYTLSFSGSFFHIADFMRRIDSLVHTGSKVAIDGRLVTLDGFSLTANSERSFPYLDATFSVTTYLTPPSQGITAGATPTAPAPSTSVPASSSGSAGGEAGASSETVAAR
jgi:Tfp pilus assembly protein PilO